MTDSEAYCYLKAGLPEGWKAVAEPRKGYFSEWLFSYKVYHGDELVEWLRGDFRELSAGDLVNEVRRILDASRKQTATEAR